MACTHCGHRAGLVHPDWFGAGMGRKKERDYWLHVHKPLNAQYMSFVDQIGPPIDYLLSNGDLIDGRGEKNGGTELVTRSVGEQCEMAIELIKPWEARTHVFLAGTAYHTGLLEDFEQIIARAFGAELESHVLTTIKDENITIDIKHKVGRSAVPHGRATAPLRAKLWNQIKALRGEEPQADWIIRSHAHYFLEVADEDGIVTVTPALQAGRSHYGERECEGVVSWGLLYFEADAGEVQTSGRKYIKKIEANKTKVIVL